MNNKTPPALRKLQGFRCSGPGNLGQRPTLFFIIPQVHFHIPSVSDTLCLVALKLIMRHSSAQCKERPSELGLFGNLTGHPQRSELPGVGSDPAKVGQPWLRSLSRKALRWVGGSLNLMLAHPLAWSPGDVNALLISESRVASILDEQHHHPQGRRLAMGLARI